MSSYSTAIPNFLVITQQIDTFNALMALDTAAASRAAVISEELELAPSH